MKKDSIIRKGDTITLSSDVVRFVRCGYKVRPIDFYDQIDETYHLKTITVTENGKPKTIVVPQIAYQTFRHAIALTLANSVGFGGAERMIFTEPIDHFIGLLDDEWTVLSIQYVNTGIRDEDGEYDEYNGRYLSYPIFRDMKRHKILTVQNNHSRHIIRCEAKYATKVRPV